MPGKILKRRKLQGAVNRGLSVEDRQNLEGERLQDAEDQRKRLIRLNVDLNLW